MSSLTPLNTHKRLFWLSAAVCATLGFQPQALAAVDAHCTANSPGISGNMESSTPADWSASTFYPENPSGVSQRSSYAEWHGYAPRMVPNSPFPVNGWSAEPGADNAMRSWNNSGQTVQNRQMAASPAWNQEPINLQPSTVLNEVAEWVPPPPGPYPNGPHEGALDMTPPLSSGWGSSANSPAGMPGYGMPQYGPAPYRGPGMPWQNGPRPGYGAPAYGPPAYNQGPYGPPPFGPQPGYGAPVNPMYGSGAPPMRYPQGPHYGPPPAYGNPDFGPMPYPGPAMPWQNGPRPGYGAPTYGPPAYSQGPYGGPPPFGPQPGYGAPVNPMYGAGVPPMGDPQGPNYGPPPAYGRPDFGPMPYPGPAMPWQNGPRPGYGAPTYGPPAYSQGPYGGPPPFGPQPGYEYP